MWYRTVGGIVTLMLSLLTAPLTLPGTASSARAPAWAAHAWLCLWVRVPPSRPSGTGCATSGTWRATTSPWSTALQKGRRIGSPRAGGGIGPAPRGRPRRRRDGCAPSCPARHHDPPHRHGGWRSCRGWLRRQPRASGGNITGLSMMIPDLNWQTAGGPEGGHSHSLSCGRPAASRRSRGTPT